MVKIRTGDWTCPGCRTIVFASKDKCIKCNFDRSLAAKVGEPDWVCKHCQEINRASKKECVKCGTARSTSRPSSRENSHVDEDEQMGGATPGEGPGSALDDQGGSGYGTPAIGGEPASQDDGQHLTPPGFVIEEQGPNNSPRMMMNPFAVEAQSSFNVDDEISKEISHQNVLDMLDDTLAVTKMSVDRESDLLESSLSQAALSHNKKGDGKKGGPNNRLDGDWDCVTCGVMVFGSKDKCFKCSRAKPKVAKDAPNRREGDWDCWKCGELVFAKKSKCFVCNFDRRDEPPAGGRPRNRSTPRGRGAGRSRSRDRQRRSRSRRRGDHAADLSEPIRNPTGEVREGDWSCPSCATHCFAFRDNCFKCGYDKRKGGASVEQEQPVRSQRTGRMERDQFGEQSQTTRKGNGKAADWPCPKCGTLVFGSKDDCFKCGYSRATSSSAAPPSQRTAAATGQPTQRRGAAGGGQQDHPNARPGDWNCPGCGMLVFGSKDSCFKCGYSRLNDAGPPGTPGGASGTRPSNNASGPYSSFNAAPTPVGASSGAGSQNVRPGDWACPKCNTNVFASKDSCFKCGYSRSAPGGAGGGKSAASKGKGSGKQGSDIVRPGDWPCPKCNTNVFASKDSCFKCGYRREVLAH
ncbi:unnamed protein product [Amoebophrya sp. A120]|nr:unnamed protein product [Amoebophrya sp. A120]|eukprot:GSA120T00004380001.1